MIKKGLWNTKRGVALLLVISILGLLVLIGTSFALNMLLTRKETTNFLNSVKARYIAEAGINRALADMRSRVKTDSYGNLTAYINGYVAASGTDVAFGQGTYTLSFSTDTSGNVISEADKVNISSFDEFDNSQINILRTAGLTNRDIALIIDYRDYDSNATLIIGPPPGNGVENAGCKDRPYATIEEVKAAFINGGATVAAANTSYNLIKDKVTVNKPIMRGGLLAKYFSNITGTSPSVVIDESAASFEGEIIELGNFEEHYIEGGDGDTWDQDSGWLESHDAEFAGGHLITSPGDFGLNTFAVRYEGYIEILPSEVSSPITFRIKIDDGIRFFIEETDVLGELGWKDQFQASGNASNYTFSYTFQAPGWHRIRIDYYDNTGENAINLKWGGSDWNTASFVPAERFGYEAPTETIPASVTPTIYNNAGNYNITCTAKVTIGTQVLAQKRISAVIRFFGTWTQTTKDEFYAAWFNDYATGIPSGYVRIPETPQTPPPSGGVDYRDGEMRNVTWLDSCPLNATDDLEAGGYTTQSDSLKLGLWIDGDSDSGYTSSMLKALVLAKKWEDTPADPDNPKGWINIIKDDGGSNFFFISWGDFNNGYTADGSDNELTIVTGWHEGRRFEVNPFYYFPSLGTDHKLVDGTPDVFMRVWTAVDYAPSKIESGGNWEPRTYWVGEGTLYTGTLDTDGNPNGSGVYAGIPVDANGTEIVDNPYTGDGGRGYGYDINSDGLYQIGERICKVHPKNSTTRTMIYGASPFNLDAWPGNYTYWQSEAPFATPMIYAAGERMDDINLPAQRGARGFSLLQKDTDNEDTGQRGWTYAVHQDLLQGDDEDMLELIVNSATDTTLDNPAYVNRVWWAGKDFLPAATLTMIGRNGEYRGNARGKKGVVIYNRFTPKVTPDFPVTTPNFQFLSRNVYDASGDVGGWNDWAKWMTSTVVKTALELKRSGGNSTVTTYWDNIRIIPASGFLVSAPHVARSSTDADAAWGTVSWTEDKPANTDVKIYLRSTSTGLPTSDNFSALYANGASVAGTGRVIQYKAVLTSTAFDATTGFYAATGGVTPRLDDVTITYDPTVQVLYWREF